MGMPSIFSCPLCQHGRAIPWHISLSSPYYVRLITPWTWSPQLSSSTSVPSPQSNVRSYQGTPPLWCQLTTHLQWWKLFLEPPTQVNVKFSAIMTWQFAYGYFSLHLLHVLDKLVVKHLHVISGWKVRRSHFWPHGNKCISKCKIISECEQLQVHYWLFLWYE